MNPLCEQIDTPNPVRRGLLAGFVCVYTASLIPWALAQEVTDADMGAFLALSAILAGRQSLDAAQAGRLYAALVADDPGFPTAAKTLLDTIEQRKIDPMQLQKVLDDEKSPLGALPRRDRDGVVHGHRRRRRQRALRGLRDRPQCRGGLPMC